MERLTFNYCFKIWLTSLLAAPPLFAAILCVRQIEDITELLREGLMLVPAYLVFVIVQLIGSVPTLVFFWLLVLLTAKLPIGRRWRIWIIFCIGIALTIGTFALVLNALDSFDNPNGLINLMYANCAGIGWGVFYYKLETNYKELRSFK